MALEIPFNIVNAFDWFWLSYKTTFDSHIHTKSKQTSDNQLHITLLFCFSFDQKGLVAFQAFIYTTMNFPNEFTSSFLLRSTSRDCLHHKGENRLECFAWNKWLKTSSTTTHKRSWIFICRASDDDVNLFIIVHFLPVHSTSTRFFFSKYFCKLRNTFFFCTCVKFIK